MFPAVFWCQLISATALKIQLQLPHYIKATTYWYGAHLMPASPMFTHQMTCDSVNYVTLVVYTAVLSPALRTL